jgi:hypothetical protein
MRREKEEEETGEKRHISFHDKPNALRSQRPGCLKKGGNENGKTETDELRDKQIPENERVEREKGGAETEEKKHVSFRDKPNTLQSQRAGCFMKGGNEDGKMEAEGSSDKQRREKGKQKKKKKNEIFLEDEPLLRSTFNTPNYDRLLAF